MAYPSITYQIIKRKEATNFSLSTESYRVKMGMGLHIAFRITNDHNGELRIGSTPGMVLCSK